MKLPRARHYRIVVQGALSARVPGALLGPRGASGSGGCRVDFARAGSLDRDRYCAFGLDDRRLDVARARGPRSDRRAGPFLLRVDLSSRDPAADRFLDRRTRAAQALQDQSIPQVVHHQVHRSDRSARVGGAGHQPHRLARPDSPPPPGLRRRHPAPVARWALTRWVGLIRPARRDPPVFGNDPPSLLPCGVPSRSADGCLRPPRTAAHPARPVRFLHQLHPLRLRLSGGRRAARQTPGQRVPRVPQLPRVLRRGEPALRSRVTDQRRASAVARCGRRRFLLTVAGSAAFAPVLRLSGSGLDGRAHDAIRPPGALDEEAFLARCITCGACSASCPTGVIRADLGKSGVEGLFTPILDMRRGWCEPSCIRCGEVCPTEALTVLDPDAKQAIGGPAEVTIGTAFFDRGRCLPWAMETPCIVCEEMCPTSPKAIFFEDVEITRRDGASVALQRPLDSARTLHRLRSVRKPLPRRRRGRHQGLVGRRDAGSAESDVAEDPGRLTDRDRPIGNFEFRISDFEFVIATIAGRQSTPTRPDVLKALPERMSGPRPADGPVCQTPPPHANRRRRRPVRCASPPLTDRFAAPPVSAAAMCDECDESASSAGKLRWVR